MRKIGFVGAGNMAAALAGGIAGSGDKEFVCQATDPLEEARSRFVAQTGATATGDLAELVKGSDVLVLAVKPQVVPSLLQELAPLIETEQVVVSIAAGVTLGTLEAGLGRSVRLVRAMPNTPALVRRGVTVVARGGAATEEDLGVVERVLSGVGQVLVVDDEGLLDAVTAVSGSGPGFVFAFAEALIAAAGEAGLPEPMATVLVQETLAGAAELWRSSEETAEELRRRVTSPGGTTEAGLGALDEAGFSEAVGSAIRAAALRSQELSGY